MENSRNYDQTCRRVKFHNRGPFQTTNDKRNIFFAFCEFAEVKLIILMALDAYNKKKRPEQNDAI